MRNRQKIANTLKNLLPEQIYSILKKPIRSLLGPTCIHMLRENLDIIPPFKHREKYTLDLKNVATQINSGQNISLFEQFQAETLNPGRESDYIQVMRMSMKEDADETWFKENFSNDKEYDPKYLVLIYHKDEPIAAAASWQTEWKKRKTGLIHNVGVHKDFRRLGFGRIVTLLAMHQLKARGFNQALLATEDYRIPAISLYYSLGFKPIYFNLFHKHRWIKILNKIEHP